MRKLLVVLALLAMLPAGSASAGIIYEAWHGTGGLTINLAGQNIGTQTGWATIRVDNVGSPNDVSPLTLNSTYDAFCVDLQHWSNSSSVGAHTANLLDWNLYQSPGTAQTQAAAAASWLLNTYLGQAGTDRSALQLAIWEVLYETGSNWLTDSGNVWFSDNAFNANAQTYLNAARDAGARNYTGGAVWIVTDNPVTNAGYYQDFATIVSVPEPGSMLLLGSGLLGLAAVVRRRGHR